ncbi:hypothetical protein JG688_00017041 [Phytophthora aleatoria]|uniref:Uncharacterized protein n=1 Tax=Phytophthora aleatoria TaxID=2496075 RepID=A0A8J5MC11_9STRA|nr:hypothetical protein JG688_00017041 [Phytophthora aleatoria]
MAMMLAGSDRNKRASFLILKTRPSTKADERVVNTKYRHGFGRTLWKKIKLLQRTTRCRIYGNTKGWWDSELSVGFF